MKLFVYALLFFSVIEMSSCSKSSGPEPGAQPDPTAPKIKQFSPLSGRFNSTLTIDGENFSANAAANKVRIGTSDAVVVNATTTQLTVLVTPGSVTGKISVEVGGKSVLSAADFTVIQPVAWSVSNSFPGGVRARFTSFSIGDKGYFMGGQSFLADYLKEVWEFNGITFAWSRKGDFPGAGRTDHLSFVIGGKAYVYGGNDGIKGMSDLWEYDPLNDKWTQKTSFPGPLRALANGFAINGKLYIGSGLDINSQPFNFFQDFWEYDPGTDKWRRVADFPGTPRWQSVSFSISGKGYLGLGVGENAENADLWEYDVIANSWTRKADFPVQRRAATFSTSVGNLGYVISGSFLVNRTTTIGFRDVWQFNPATNAWVIKEEYPGRADFTGGGFAIGNRIFYGLGGNSVGNLFLDFWTFDVLK